MDPAWPGSIFNTSLMSQEELLLALRELFRDGIPVSGKIQVELPKPGDTTAPEQSLLYPLHESLDVLVGTIPEITFNEGVKLGSGTIDIYDYETQVVYQSLEVTNPNQVVLVNGARSVRLIGADLRQGKVYYCQIPNTAIKDLAENAFAGISGFNWVWTMDSPLSEIYTPSDNATGVSIGTNIQITFSEIVELNEGRLSLYDYATDELIQEFDLVEDCSFINERILRLDNPNIQKGKQYYILITADLVRDGEGNTFPGITSKDKWNFTIEADVTGPAIIQYLPVQGATDVHKQDGAFRLRYNEAIQKGADGKKLSLYKYDDDSLIREFLIENILLDSTYLTGFLGTLQSNTQYYFFADAGLVKDLSGNDSTVINNKDTWKFTTFNDCSLVAHPVYQELSAGYQLEDDGAGNYVITWTGI